MELFKNRDNYHYNFREVDGYNSAFNFIVSPRELGKTTALLLDKAYKPFILEGKTFIMLTRFATDVSEELIQGYEDTLNKFLIKPIKLVYKLADLGKKAVFDVFIEGKRFMRFIAMNGRIDRIKKTICKNVGFMGYDEFIINPKFKESYLAGEYDKFKEIYNTYQRESRDELGNKKLLKCYFCGNLYSAFNPYFTFLGVKANDLKINNIYRYNGAVIQFEGVSDELRAQILATNPLYQFDEAYKNYALEGVAMNDINIKVGELPQGYKLDIIISIDNKFLGIYKNYNITNVKDDRYYIQFIKLFSFKRDVYCFDFSDMVNQSILFSSDEKRAFKGLKTAFRNRLISFYDISCYYYLEGIYSQL